VAPLREYAWDESGMMRDEIARRSGTWVNTTGQNMKIPARYSNVLFGGMLSIIMVTIISGAVVLINQGFDAEFFKRWSRGFITAWPVAFPCVLVVAPFVRKVVAKITA
jgi:Protein of unknown function (DUF2798)